VLSVPRVDLESQASMCQVTLVRPTHQQPSMYLIFVEYKLQYLCREPLRGYMSFPFGMLLCSEKML
jgi:hypothetical protein